MIVIAISVGVAIISLVLLTISLNLRAIATELGTIGDSLWSLEKKATLEETVNEEVEG